MASPKKCRQSPADWADRTDGVEIWPPIGFQADAVESTGWWNRIHPGAVQHGAFKEATREHAALTICARLRLEKSSAGFAFNDAVAVVPLPCSKAVASPMGFRTPPPPGEEVAC